MREVKQESKETLAFDTMDKAILLGQEIALINELDYFEISRLYENRFHGLAKSLENATQDQTLVYSGIGFTAISDFEGSVATVHKRVNLAKGKLVGIELLHKDYLNYYQRQIYDKDGEELSDDPEHDLGLYTVIRDWESGLIEPPANYRLYGRFEVAHQYGAEEEIAGSAVVADSIRRYDRIDLSTIELHDVNLDESFEQLDVFDVPEMLENIARRYRQGIRNKEFRNQSPRKQQTYLEDILDTINTALAIDRFSIILPDADFFVSQIHDGNVVFELNESLNCDVIAHCERLDCIELQGLRDGIPIRKRKGNYDSNQSLCIVAELSKDIADFLGLQSTIVWIPIINQIDRMDLPVSPLVD